MKLSEIVPGKKYYKLAADGNRKRGRGPMDKTISSVYVLDVDKRGPAVLASINGMPATWYKQSSYARWSVDKPQI